MLRSFETIFGPTGRPPARSWVENYASSGKTADPAALPLAPGTAWIGVARVVESQVQPQANPICPGWKRRTVRIARWERGGTRTLLQGTV